MSGRRSGAIRGMALFALAAAMGGTTLAVPAQAVVGTPAAAGSYSFTAQLNIGDGDKSRACTGALVDAQWIVTAASCFAADPQAPAEVVAGKPALKTIATIGRTDLTATTGGHVSEIVQIVPRAGRDMVMARLAAPATGIAPVKLATTPPAAGDALKVAGYGRTKTEWVPDKLHEANFTVDSATGDALNITGATAGDAICMGDSGGPVLRDTGSGSYELVGVSSRSWQGGCFGTEETRNGAVASRADGAALGAALLPGQRLLSGDSLISNSAKATLQADGNFVIASNAGKTLWSTGTGGNAGATVSLDATGNLVVLKADGTTKLWESKTSAPGGSAVLTDRGNFVVYTDKKESRWSSGTVIRNDYNNDGRSDIVDWYDYTDGHDAMHRFIAGPDGTFLPPVTSWTRPAGGYTADNMKFLTGDYNGDGTGDVAAFYGHTDGSMALFTWLGKGDGNFAEPLTSWKVAPGNWTAANVNPQSGDFNGDGRDDISVWYDYADGSDKLFTFLAKPDGGFANPVASFSRPKDNWWVENMKFGTGDYNGDGRDDLAVFYTYSDKSARLFTFLAKPDGGFADPVAGWESPSWGEGARSTVNSGDFNGDGRDDISVWYDYADGSDGISTFLAEADGTFKTRTVAATIPAGNLWREHMKVVAGDYNGDGRDDLGFMYGYDAGTIRMFTMTSKANGTFNGHTGSWSSTGSAWTFERVHLVERYTQQ
ncbi:FG-GAP-like repeat-containing protein [Streptomyces sp. NBC_01363]|uniref:FG-GAP-like repeat-containing protein n=1 Tax=Streptomyces sp. NBC_01363 TaxID=2903840 RepID=UPI00225754EE|nr:FG-GAP-like repeat-containing protein [Streptomyces sp. NBC_01363]MCX4734245.1 FG-GAP-like repeat-containing protein [Streptomyces sp. NBC_01363]